MDKLLEKLRSSGHKLTAQRKLILSVLTSSPQPLSVKELYGQLKHAVNRVSIYRAVQLFVNAGIVFEERKLSAIRYYVAKQQHHHITCIRCGRSECIPCAHRPIANSHFINITHEFAASGICKACA